MKRSDLERILKDCGFWFLKNSKHCLWTNGTLVLAVPHHKEVNIFTAKKLIKQAQMYIVNELKVA